MRFVVGRNSNFGFRFAFWASRGVAVACGSLTVQQINKKVNRVKAVARVGLGQTFTKVFSVYVICLCVCQCDVRARTVARVLNLVLRLRYTICPTIYVANCKWGVGTDCRSLPGGSVSGRR